MTKFNKNNKSEFLVSKEVLAQAKEQVKALTIYKKEWKKVHRLNQQRFGLAMIEGINTPPSSEFLLKTWEDMKAGKERYTGDSKNVRLMFMYRWLDDHKESHPSISYPKYISNYQSREFHLLYSLLKGTDLEKIEGKAKTPLSSYSLSEAMKFFFKEPDLELVKEILSAHQNICNKNNIVK